MMSTATITTTTPETGLAFVEAAVQTFEGIERLAGVMARCGTLPAHLQNKPQDCFRVVVQAAKWRMDPFSVAECTSIVHGRLCYEGKLVAAVLRSMNAIEGRLEYEVTGSGQNASIVVTGTARGSKRPQTLKGSVAEWRTVTKKDGQKIPNAWDNMPETMLVYRGTRQWARVYAPEAIMGVYTPDEFDNDARDVTSDAVIHPATPEDARVEPALKQSTPKEEPKEKSKPPPVHPAIEAANALWADLQKVEKGFGTRVMQRLAALNGAPVVKDINPARYDQLAKDVAALAQLECNMARVDNMLTEWEATAAEDTAKKGDV